MPYEDNEKNRVLRFIATQYANPAMNLEFSIAALGISRMRINEWLKEELG